MLGRLHEIAAFHFQNTLIVSQTITISDCSECQLTKKMAIQIFAESDRCYFHSYSSPVYLETLMVSQCRDNERAHSTSSGGNSCLYPHDLVVESNRNTTPHRYLGTNSFPDVDFYRSQSSSRSPSRTQNTNAYQQSPSRVHNIGPGLTGSAIYAVPTSYNSASFSPGHGQAASVTPEPWEAATSEFQVPAYQHEMPGSHYESQFSVNSVHDSLRDTGPWMYNPDDDRDTHVPAQRHASRPSQAASGHYETRGGESSNSIHADDNSTPKTRTNKPRTAEQKARMAKSAANRRANDKDHLSIIKERLPPLRYGQEYNNRTALAGAIARFDRDEEAILALKKECSALEHRLTDVEQELASERSQKASLTTERDELLIRWANIRADLENTKATLAYQMAAHDNTKAVLARQATEYENIKARLASQEIEHQTTKVALENTQAEVMNKAAQLHSNHMELGSTRAALQRTQAELNIFRQRYGSAW
ncbi:hypothetical protein EVG20_g7970 [Dentipellis fragilis]|uniref:Uncharacterized protein n=1 Tax=Dentipellis fragilis TaxID=205917 RepID=A0A4Y9YDH8_9AGAM|nr:hypothetical protein EVG20_g7970 [Dentipellis fragilis]